MAELPFSYFSAPGEKKSTIAPVFCILILCLFNVELGDRDKKRVQQSQL